MQMIAMEEQGPHKSQSITNEATVCPGLAIIWRVFEISLSLLTSGDPEIR